MRRAAGMALLLLPALALCQGAATSFNVNATAAVPSPLVVNQSSLTTTGGYAAATSAIVACNGTSSVNIVSIENPVGSGRLVVLKHMFVWATATGTAAGGFLLSVARASVFPSGGTVETNTQDDTATRATIAIVRRAPTATPGAPFWNTSPGFVSANNSAKPDESDVVNTTNDLNHFVMRPGEAIVAWVPTCATAWYFGAHFDWVEA